MAWEPSDVLTRSKTAALTAAATNEFRPDGPLLGKVLPFNASENRKRAPRLIEAGSSSLRRTGYKIRAATAGGYR
jgi:hypothetical protein